MGRCKFTERLKKQFPWACSVPSSEFYTRCRLDGKIISVKKGAYSLQQHELQDCHKSAVEANDRQPEIQETMTSALDEETGKLLTTFYHVLNLNLNFISYRSSDCFSRKRSLYSTMFPKAKGTNIACGRSKTRYLTVHALAPYIREIRKTEMTNKMFGLHLDESCHNNKVS